MSNLSELPDIVIRAVENYDVFERHGLVRADWF